MNQKQYHGLIPQPPYPWFAQVWTKLAARVECGQLPHALLFNSASGLGELDLVYAFAQYLLCSAPHNSTSCGTCKSCKLIKSGMHPDLVEVVPEEKSNVIKVDAIRKVADYVSNTSQQGGRKVILVHPAEAMNTNAANALLKNLEEPNGDTVFLLLSRNTALLMATVRSRCSGWLLSAPSTGAALEWLNRSKIADASLKLAKANGQPLTVIQWEEDDTYSKADALATITKCYLTGESELVKASKALLGFDPLWVMDQWLQWLQLEARNSKSADVASAYIETAFAGNAINVFHVYDKLRACKRLLLAGSNPNQQLLFEGLLLEFKRS